MRRLLVQMAVLTMLSLITNFTLAQSSPETSFFITSAGPGNGANLGGLAGADQHCQNLAAAVGAGQKTWRAYLSTSAVGGSPAVNARDRIGQMDRRGGGRGGGGGCGAGSRRLWVLG